MQTRTLGLVFLVLGCGRSTTYFEGADGGVQPDVIVPDVATDVPSSDWVRRLGGEGPAGETLFDEAGNVFFVGGSTITSHAPDGATRWGRSLWGARITDAALKGDRVVVVGLYERAINLGDGALDAPPRYRPRIFVASYTTEGELRWSRGFGDVHISVEVSLDLDDAGNLYLGGSIRGGVDFGGGLIEYDDAEFSEMYMASFTRDGAHRWSRGFDRGYRYDRPEVVVGDEGVYLSGLFSGPTSFGGDTFETRDYSQPFIASFTTEGVHRWSTALDEPLVLRGGREGRLFVEGAVPAELIADGVTRVSFADGFLGMDAADNVYMREGNTRIHSYRPDGTLRWERRFDLTTAVESFSFGAAVDARGNVVATGAFEGDVDVFEGDVEDGWIHGSGRFIASYSATGAPRWVRRHGSPWRRRVHEVASDAEGNVYVVGTFTGDADFGEARQPTREESELYLASFAPDGSPRWSRTFGHAGPPYLRQAITVNERGVTIAGLVSGSLVFGGREPMRTGAYLARFTTDGAYRWSRNLAGSLVDYYAGGLSIAVGPSGVVHVVQDGALERFDDRGEPLGTTPLPSGGTIALDPEGNIILAVVSPRPIDLGGGVLEAPTSTDLVPYGPRPGSLAVAVASLTPDGAHRWSEVLGVPGDDGQVDVASDREGNVVVLARGRDRCSFGCRPVAYSLALVASLSPDGELRWSHRLPGVGGVAAGPGLALGERGEVFVTGNYLGPLELPEGRVLPEPDLSDGLLAIFAPDGSLRRSEVFGGPFGHAEGQRVAPDGEGGAYITGTFGGALDAGFITLASESARDTVLIRFGGSEVGL